MIFHATAAARINTVAEKIMSLLLEKELERNKENIIAVQKETVDWMCGIGTGYSHAVNLTFPFNVKDEDEADVYIGKFVKYLNKKCNRRAKTHNERVKMAIVIEGLNGDREKVHVHCAIKSPNKFTFKVFSKLVKEAWKKAVRNNEAIVDIDIYENNGWVGYFVKRFTTKKTNGISQHCNF
jgi:hypothetical protein